MPCDCFFDADRDVRVASDKTGRLSLRLDHMLRVVRPGAFVVSPLWLFAALFLPFMLKLFCLVL